MTIYRNDEQPMSDESEINTGRHQRVDPNMDLRQRIKTQIVEEYERLNRIADKFEGDGQDNLAEAARFLAEQWLVVLSEELEKY